MATKDIAALAGIALGIAAGLKKGKRDKVEREQKDTMFDLQKQQAELNIKIAQKQWDDAEAAGHVFTPEQRAEFQRIKAEKEAELQDLEMQAKTQDIAKGKLELDTFGEDRALDRQLKQANLGYMGAMTRRMDREPAGGGSGEDGVNVNLQRELVAMENAAQAFKEIHQNENGEWDSEESYRQWQGMRQQYINRIYRWGDRVVPKLPVGDVKGAAKGRENKPRMGAPRASDALVEKGGERTYWEDVQLNLMRPLESVGEAAKGGWRWLTGTAPDYVDDKGQAVDVSGLGTEQVKKMEAQGLIKRIERGPLATGTGGYMGF